MISADRARGALVGVVVGDALGAPFEGRPGPVAPRALSAVFDGTTELPYTDDTATTFDLAESLLERGGLDLDHLAATLARTYERQPHRGYGAGAAHLLRQVAEGAGWRPAAAAQFGGQGSFGNGAAMRVAPIALLARGDVEKAARLGRASATVTHTHPEGADAAGVQAGAVALALASSGPMDRHRFVDRVLDVTETEQLRDALSAVADLEPDTSPGDVGRCTGTGVAAVEAVPAAIAAVTLHPDSFSDAVRFAVRLGGDTDTIASMAGAIAGARLGQVAIPGSWLDRAEGVARAAELADRLLRVGGAAPPA
ncbi:MAG TPA: ADP-ribosylglycohydrolase family protein [Acidimicrobiales bacterium]|nr:ADP-ribosylglycohydrolase family protein [Acidimicrobiales bacterium]